MDESLRTGLIMFAITSVVAGLAWLFVDLRSEVKALAADVRAILVAAGSTVTEEKHNGLAKSLRDDLSVLRGELAVIRDRTERKP